MSKIKDPYTGEWLQGKPEREIEEIARKAQRDGTKVTRYEVAIGVYLNPDNLFYNPEKGIYWLERVAEDCFMRAAAKLGELYEKGDLINRDNEKALYWYKQAAEMGSFAAQYDVARFYLCGIGVPKDPITAVAWLCEASQQDSHLAQYELGLCYLVGNGTGQNIGKAHYWFSRAATNGSRGARKMLAIDPRLISDSGRVAQT